MSLTKRPGPDAQAETTIADRLLVDLCLTGNEAAWARLYAQCQPGLLASIRTNLGWRFDGAQLAEEIASRVWYALVKGEGQLLDRFDPERGCRLSTYLASLARKEVLRHRRSERRRRLHEAGAGRCRIDRRDDSWHAQLELGEYLATLTPRERQYCEVHLLAAAAEGGHPGFSRENAWQLRHRALRKLFAFLAFNATTTEREEPWLPQRPLDDGEQPATIPVGIVRAALGSK